VSRLPAITIWQPYAWAIAAGHKRVENRTWLPRIVGVDIAIHAGKTLDEDALLAMQVGSYLPDRGDAPEADQLARGAVVAVARLFAATRYPAMVQSQLGAGQLRWFNGPVGWLLSDVRRLPEPVPCRGAQGLWALPGDVDAAVRRQVEVAA
jgi:hypothetical protein